ncbi:MAG: CpXC domain-containing protein [Deltaproteobacteria bacterium]|nr:CpXC domain-containing protein [Deltaproteobacteria bacterium]
MAIIGTARVRCPACGLEQDAELVQSINTQKNPSAKQRLLDGELNVLTCACGKRTQLAANLLFSDPATDYLCQVCPGGDEAMAKAAETFRAVAAGARGPQRLVPTLNALVEKVKLLDAGLEDWAIEMTKVLLLASLGNELDRVLLFDSVDREASVLHWVLFDEDGRRPAPMASPLHAYTKLVTRTQGKPAPGELQIDRAWAVQAVREMISNAN